MYILDQTGTRLIKIDDYTVIMINDEAKNPRKNANDPETSRYTIRALYKTNDQPGFSVILSRYKHLENAQLAFIEMVAALDKGKNVFSFCVLPVTASSETSLGSASGVPNSKTDNATSPADNDHEVPER